MPGSAGAPAGREGAALLNSARGSASPHRVGQGRRRQSRGAAGRGGDGEPGVRGCPGAGGTRERPLVPRLRAAGSPLPPPAPCTPTHTARREPASQSQRPAPGPPRDGTQPRRQWEPRIVASRCAGVCPAPALLSAARLSASGRGSAALTFLRPRKSLRRVPLRPLPSLYGTDRRVSPESSSVGPGRVPCKGPVA